MGSIKLDLAKKAKGDEYYTQYSDIEKEIDCYNKIVFCDKIIYCNCDNPKISQFWKYFHINFQRLKLKLLIATHINEDFIFIYEGGNDKNVSMCSKRMLENNGDFRNVQCIELLKKADIVVTNPPFSLFRQFISILNMYNKKFLILGSQNAITYKEVYPLIISNKLWYGSSIKSGGRVFQIPDNYNSYGKNVFVVNGHHFIELSGIRWFTNIEYQSRYERLKLSKTFNEIEKQKYDNFDAININSVKDIPVDYDGIMGVPISFLSKYNPEQFRIVGFRKGNDGKDLSVNGKCPYFRILIQRKS